MVRQTVRQQSGLGRRRAAAAFAAGFAAGFAAAGLTGATSAAIEAGPAGAVAAAGVGVLIVLLVAANTGVAIPAIRATPIPNTAVRRAMRLVKRFETVASSITRGVVRSTV